MKSFLIILILCFTVFAQSEAEKQGREIFEKYQAAIGGKENIAKIKTVEIISESETINGKKKTIEVEDKVNKRSYVSSVGDTGKLEMGSDGSRHWMRRGGRADYINFTPAEEAVKYVKLPNEKIDGKEYLVVEEVKSDTRGNAKTYYDPNTFLLIRREQLAGFSGQTFTMSKNFSDYRKVDEFLVPFAEVSENGVSGKSTKRILSVRYNIEVDPKIFELNGKGLEIPKDIPAPKPDLQSKATSQPIVFTANKNVFYKDEDGKVISQEEFRGKQLGVNYLTEVELSDGKLVGLRLKKGNPETAIGAISPDFTASTLDNSSIQLSQLKGKVVVMNFWFLACGPCIKEMPELNELVKKYQGKDVEFIAVTFDKQDLVAESLKIRPFNYKQIVDAQNIIDLYKATAFPAHLILDKNGKVLFAQFGNNSKIIEHLTKIIDSALS